MTTSQFIFTNVSASKSESYQGRTCLGWRAIFLTPTRPIITAMFLPVLRSQASDEQLKVWGPQAENFHIIGW